MIRARFEFNPRVVAGLIDEQVVLVQKKVAFQLLSGIVNMNPVKTGRSRGNWQVTIGAPADGSLATVDPSGSATIAAGEATIQSLTTLGAIYLTNNLPYILRLEEGSSAQAPAGMVQVTLDRVGSQFR